MAVTRYAWLFGCGWTTFGYMAMIYGLSPRRASLDGFTIRYYLRTVASVPCGAAHTMACEMREGELRCESLPPGELSQ